MLSLDCPVYVHDLHCKSSFNIVHPFQYKKIEEELGFNFMDYGFIFPDESAQKRHMERTMLPLIESCVFKKERKDGEVIQKPKDYLSKLTILNNNDFIIFHIHF